MTMSLFQRAVVLLFPAITTIMIVRLIGGISFSFTTIVSLFLSSSRTDPRETGTLLAIYAVTLASLVNMLAAPVLGTIFDTFGTRWLYAF